MAEFERELERAKTGQERALRDLESTTLERRVLRRRVWELEEEARRRQEEVEVVQGWAESLRLDRDAAHHELTVSRADASKLSHQVRITGRPGSAAHVCIQVQAHLPVCLLAP